VWGVVGLAVAASLAFSGPAAAGEKDHGYMGVYMQQLTRDIREGLGLDVKRGVLVSGVEDDSPAARAGFEDGDVIVEFNGEAVDGPDELRDMVMDMNPGDEVQVLVFRDGEQKTLEVVLGEREGGWSWIDSRGDFGRQFNILRGDGLHTMHAFFGGPRLGVQASELNDDLASYFDTSAGEGVLVLDVVDDSIAQKAGVKPGDVIRKVDDESVASVDDLRDALGRYDEGDEFKVTVLRKGKEKTLDAVMDDQSAKTFWSGDSPQLRLKVDRDEIDSALDELRDEIKELKKQIKELKDDA
jgi:serine protease Do